MSIPTCASCKSTMFEVAEFTPDGYTYKLVAIHCKLCGAIATVIDFYNVNMQLDNLREMVEDIQRKVNKA